MIFYHLWCQGSPSREGSQPSPSSFTSAGGGGGWSGYFTLCDRPEADQQGKQFIDNNRSSPSPPSSSSDVKEIEEMEFDSSDPVGGTDEAQSQGRSRAGGAAGRSSSTFVTFSDQSPQRPPRATKRPPPPPPTLRWQFDKNFLPEKWPQNWPENWPKVLFEKDTCINFQFWTFRDTFWPFLLLLFLS